jgi:LacI family transcriptional regulator
MLRKNQITLDDIAKKIGVSKVTVSKALRDHSDIGVKTKALVKKVAKELGYTPNYIARNLSAKRSFTVGLVVPKIAHNFFASAIESIYDVAYKNNYEIIVTVSQESAEKEALHIQSLLSMRVDGLLVSVTQETMDYSIFNKVHDMNIPLVFFDRVIEDLGFSCVSTADQKGAYQLTECAISRGYREIAHIAGYRQTSIGKNRLYGYTEALKDYGIDLDEGLIIEGGFSENDGYNGFMQLYNKGVLPEIILAVTFPVALGVYRAAEELGLSVPHDVDVVSFGGSNYNRFIKPSITYVDQPSHEIGRRSMEQLLREIEHPEIRGKENIAIESKIIKGQTCIKKSSELLLQYKDSLL